MNEAVSRERTHNYLHQIKGAVVYRALAMAASFLAIPMMIHYLGQEQFGVWSTLLTVMSWMVFFDLGVGNGLRNKVAESLAKEKKTEAAAYIASVYTLIGLIALGILAAVTAASYFVPWQVVFNTEAISESTLRETIQIAAFFIVLNFWIGLITALLNAVQRTSMVALGQLVTNLLLLVLVYFLERATDASITKLALIYGISIVSTNILLSYLFYKDHSELRPRVSLDRAHLSPLLTLGLQFFTIQFAVLIIFTTDKMLITQLFGPEYVTEYEVVFKLFSLITFAHTLISAPLWSAYTDAYHREDFGWIKSMLGKQMAIFLGIVTATCLLALLSKPIIKFWIGHEITVSYQMIVVIGLFVLISAWNNIFAILLNGISNIKLQLYTAVVAMSLNIPLSIFFAKHTEFGVSGIVVGTICSLMIASIALPVQVFHLMRSSVRESQTA